MKALSLPLTLTSIGTVVVHTICTAPFLFAQAFTPSANEPPGESTPQKPQQYSVRVFFAPQVQYRTLMADALEQSIVSERNEHEQAAIGFSTGIAGAFHCAEQWRLLAGLAFSVRGYQTRPRAITFVSPTAPTQPAPQESFVASAFSSIDIPIGIEYRIAEANGWRMFAALEAVPSVVLSKTTTHRVRTEGAWSAENALVRGRGFDRLSLLFKGSVGVQYFLSDRFAAQVSGQFQHSVVAVQSQLGMKELLYGGGLELSIQWTP
jgi:hypothetical protein